MDGDIVRFSVILFSGTTELPLTNSLIIFISTSIRFPVTPTPGTDAALIYQSLRSREGETESEREYV